MDVGFGIGRRQVVRAAGGGGGGDMTATRCRRMGCNRLTGVVTVLMSVAAAAAAATMGVVVVAVVVGVVTVALRGDPREAAKHLGQRPIIVNYHSLL